MERYGSVSWGSSWSSFISSVAALARCPEVTHKHSACIHINCVLCCSGRGKKKLWIIFRHCAVCLAYKVIVLKANTPESSVFNLQGDVWQYKAYSHLSSIQSPEGRGRSLCHQLLHILFLFTSSSKYNKRHWVNITQYIRLKHNLHNWTKPQYLVESCSQKTSMDFGRLLFYSLSRWAQTA